MQEGNGGVPQRARGAPQGTQEYHAGGRQQPTEGRKTRAPSGVCVAFQHKSDCGSVESAGLQKARLLGTLLEALRKRVELPRPHGAATLDFGRRECGALRLDEHIIELVFVQFHDDASDAVARRAPMREALGETCVGQQFFAFERIEQRVELLGAFGVRRELPGKFDAAVFAARQRVERARLQRPGWQDAFF